MVLDCLLAELVAGLRKRGVVGQFVFADVGHRILGALMEQTQSIFRHLDQVVAWHLRCLRRASRDASGQVRHVADVEARFVPILAPLVEFFQRDLGNVVFFDHAVQVRVGFAQLGRQALSLGFAEPMGVFGRDDGQQLHRRRERVADLGGCHESGVGGVMVALPPELVGQAYHPLAVLG